MAYDISIIFFIFCYHVFANANYHVHSCMSNLTVLFLVLFVCNFTLTWLNFVLPLVEFIFMQVRLIIWMLACWMLASLSTIYVQMIRTGSMFNMPTHACNSYAVSKYQMDTFLVGFYSILTSQEKFSFHEVT